MKIHTVKVGDTVFKIARKYNTSPLKIIENNELEAPDSLAVGQKLVIISPTRTYTVRGLDRAEKIAERFGIPLETLLANNPYMYGSNRIYPGQLLAIKYENAGLGTASANGYYFKGTKDERLALALPYLTYLTVASVKKDERGLRELFDDRRIVEMCNKRKKLPLLRIYDETLDFSDEYADAILSTLKERGYKGVTLAAYSAIKERKKDFEGFLLKLKKLLMQNDLLLFIELDGNSETDVADVADGYFIMYEKSCLERMPSFEDGEKRIMTEFAKSGEPSKAYIEIPSFAYRGNEEMKKSEAEKTATSAGKEILYDDKLGICHYEYNRYTKGKKDTVSVVYEAPENIKNKLELIGELGFMGITFDIEHIPTEYLMMFETMFSHPYI